MYFLDNFESAPLGGTNLPPSLLERWSIVGPGSLFAEFDIEAIRTSQAKYVPSRVTTISEMPIEATGSTSYVEGLRMMSDASADVAVRGITERFANRMAPVRMSFREIGKEHNPSWK